MTAARAGFLGGSATQPTILPVEAKSGHMQHASPDRKVDVRLPGKGNSNPHGARPVHLIITMIKWIECRV